MYIKYAQSQEELRHAEDEVTRLTNYLEHIRQGTHVHVHACSLSVYILYV